MRQRNSQLGLRMTSYGVKTTFHGVPIVFSTAMRYAMDKTIQEVVKAAIDKLARCVAHFLLHPMP